MDSSEFCSIYFYVSHLLNVELKMHHSLFDKISNCETYKQTKKPMTRSFVRLLSILICSLLVNLKFLKEIHEQFSVSSLGKVYQLHFTYSGPY